MYTERSKWKENSSCINSQPKSFKTANFDRFHRERSEAQLITFELRNRQCFRVSTLTSITTSLELILQYVNKIHILTFI